MADTRAEETLARGAPEHPMHTTSTGAQSSAPTETPNKTDGQLQNKGESAVSADDKNKQGGEPGSGEGKGSEPKEGSRRRLFKKKDMPGGLWLKCERCNDTIFRKELEEKKMVCPACGFHFTLAGNQRVEMLLDPGTWDERFSELTGMDRLGFTDKVPYSEKIERTTKRLGQNEALLCGFGAIDGQKLVVAILDFTYMGGSMGEVVGEKIALAAELAMTNRLPLVIFTSSGGARMHEGMLSLMQMAKTCAALHKLNKQGGFSICVMTNPTTGGVTASFASVCDITLAEPGALIGFAGPRVIATTLKQELPPGFQRAEFLLERGQLDAIVPRDKMRETLVSLIGFGRKAWE
ncbi:MAG: acetyl-CoA carboxylase carboxyl transferase subunit beta [Candidatus Paceibacteria bacterium]|jgi:acetyl-CoA carboxylase carboxyl transferase subunit beta